MALVVVSGAIANKPWQGGEAWVRLSWLRGFARLGCEVYFLEQLAESACVDGQGARVPFEQSEGVVFFNQVASEFGLAGKAAVVLNEARNVFGASIREIEQLAAENITAGCGGNNYCPNDPITRGQMAVFLTKTFGLKLYGP